MRFSVLGPLNVSVDCRVDITPRTPKLRSLLAILCVNSECVVSAQQITNILWGGEPPKTAATALHVHVSKLRKHFSKAGFELTGLLTKPPGYTLSIAGHELDLHEFDTLMVQARDSLAAGDRGEALEILTLASALWTGPALADLRGTLVFDNIGRQLDERKFECYELRFDLEILLGRHRQIVGELFGLIANYPTWETIYWYLMLALYRSGRASEALAVYNALRRVLVTELGMDPSARLRRLHVSILSREAWLDEQRSLAH